MKITSVAPRLRASIPIAPEPAKTSMNREFSTAGPSTLKRVSRRRSLLGRSFRGPGPFKTRLRYLPAMTRIMLSHRGQVITFSPGRTQRFEFSDYGGSLLRHVGERERFAPGDFQNLAITQWLGHREGGVAVLPGAEKFPRAAQFQILLGNLKSVGRSDHRFDSGQGLACDFFWGDQNAGRFCRAPANTSAELMEWGETEAIGVLDDHDGGVGNVHADLDDGSRDQKLNLVAAEAFHH